MNIITEGIDEAIQRHASQNKLEETLKKEKAHIDLEDSLSPKPLEVRKFLVK